MRILDSREVSVDQFAVHSCRPWNPISLWPVKAKQWTKASECLWTEYLCFKLPLQTHCTSTAACVPPKKCAQQNVQSSSANIEGHPKVEMLSVQRAVYAIWKPSPRTHQQPGKSTCLQPVSRTTPHPPTWDGSVCQLRASFYNLKAKKRPLQGTQTVLLISVNTGIGSACHQSRAKQTRDGLTNKSRSSICLTGHSSQFNGQHDNMSLPQQVPQEPLCQSLQMNLKVSTH